MTRRRDWVERLVAALDRISGESFSLGRSDCFTLAMDVVEALTGSDPWSSERGRYRTMPGAARRLRAAGFASMEAFVASLGPAVHPASAGRGDIGIAAASDGSAAVVVFDGAHWLGRSETVGFCRLSRASVTRAHRID